MISLREAKNMAMICDLTDCISATVTEALNSSFEMSLTYPIVGTGFSELKVNRLLLCKPNPYEDEQIFRIYKISKPINGICTVYAEHISYSLNNYVCFPNTLYREQEGSCGTLMAHMTICAGTNAAESGYYSLGFSTDIAGSEKWYIDSHKTIKDIMAYAVGLFGGEWKFTSESARLLQRRGANRGVALQYGENIIDITHNTDNSAVYTHLMPYARYTPADTGEEEYIYCDGYFYPVSMEQDSTKYFKPYILDVTDMEGVTEWIERGERPPAANVLAAAMHWSMVNGAVISGDDINVTVQVLQRGKTAEFAHLTDADHIELGDSISVSAEQVGITASKRVVKVVYDVLGDRVTSVELGALKRSLQDTAAKVQKKEREENADTSDNDTSKKESNEIPEQVTKVSENEVYFLFKETKVTWTASGSGDTRKNFKKTVEKRTDTDLPNDDVESGA